MSSVPYRWNVRCGVNYQRAKWSLVPKHTYTHTHTHVEKVSQVIGNSSLNVASSEYSPSVGLLMLLLQQVHLLSWHRPREDFGLPWKLTLLIIWLNAATLSVCFVCFFSVSQLSSLTGRSKGRHTSHDLELRTAVLFSYWRKCFCSLKF